MIKTYGKTGAALLAAALLCTGGAVQAAEFTVNSQEDLTEEKGWTMYGLILAPTQGTSGNEVIIGRGETQPGFNISQISGAYSTTDTVSGNSVILESGWVHRLYGGYSENGIVTGNTATISGGTVDGVYGGWSKNGDASGNKAVISGGIIEENVCGGMSGGSATENTVTISGGKVQLDVVGGWSENGSAERNTVTISDGEVQQNVYGGQSENRSAESNTVTISGGTVGTVYGGQSSEGSATGNTVTLSGGEVQGNVYGGYSYYSIGSVENNTVILSGDADVSGARLYGGYTWGGGDVLNNTVTISGITVNGPVYGGCSMYSPSGSAERNTVTISGGEVQGNVYGGYSEGRSASDNTVTISDGTVKSTVYGGYSYGDGSVSGNTVTLSGGKMNGSVYGGYSAGSGSVSDNMVTLTGTANAEGANLYGSNKEVSTANSGNKLVVDNWSGTVGGLHNFAAIDFQNVAMQEVTDETDPGHEMTLEAANGNVSGMDRTTVKVTSLSGLTAGDVAAGTTYRATVTWDDAIQAAAADVSAVTGSQWLTSDRNEGGLYVNQYDTDVKENGSHKVVLESSVTASALTSKFIDSAGQVVDASRPFAIGDGFTTNVDTVAGAYAAGSQNATGGQLYITENPADGFTKTIYAGYSESGNANGNDVYIGNADHAVHADRVILRGDNGNGSDNTLHVTGMGNTLGSIGQFNTLAFDNVTLYGAGEEGTAALSVMDADLTGASVSLNSLKGGTNYQAGDHVTLLQSTNDMNGADSASVKYSGNVTAGVAQDLQIETEQTATSIGMTVKSVSLASQTLTIAENRTAAAAFLNQGADIAADSLDLLGFDYQYGLRTFGAVYGSRSTYDAAGDLKINGWSEIVGLGNVHRKGDGDLSWGIFYENGTGNYRTWNEWNNEMFRGDGSLLYNGGGAAVRYKQDNGWYYEASVRAGTLSASMDNAVKDGNSQSYGFDSDSTYWGAHAGVGKVIETEQGEWNVYGKYFHTDIDGDSFAIDGDRFEFDSLTSDRLRLGARYTADKAKQWSLYYGLAWEYEFTGDSHMRAAGMNAPEQSLGGSTGIAEIGTVWQPDDSPWQANINLKGYAGEREGVSGMVQLAYTF